MTDLNLNTLPAREDLKRAIEPWWAGGGTASLIVDVCRGGEATIAEAKDVAERLAARVAAGRDFMSREVVEEALEMVRVVALSPSKKKEVKPSTKYGTLSWDSARGWVFTKGSSPKPEYDPDRCVYVDGVTCPQCSKIYDERVVHGHLLSEEETIARIAEVRALLLARDEEETA